MGKLAYFIFRWLWKYIKTYVEGVICLHFCKFKEAGSDLVYTHVHLYTATSDRVNGVGHDDHTNPGTPYHTTESKDTTCEFHADDTLSNGSKTAYFHPGGWLWATAYFHPCKNNEPCPPGYTRIRCKCLQKNGECQPVDVCYTLNHEHFQRWYDEQKWKNRTGTYRYPSTNVRGSSPISINCGSTIVIAYYAIKAVATTAGYDGPNDGNNPVVQEALKELQKAADGISCAGACNKTITEVFRGWMCDTTSVPGTILATAEVQWEVTCK